MTHPTLKSCHFGAFLSYIFATPLVGLTLYLKEPGKYIIWGATIINQYPLLHYLSACGKYHDQKQLKEVSFGLFLIDRVHNGREGMPQ